MKKFFILFFSFIILTSSAFAEKLPTKGDPSFSKETNPLWYKYLEDYTNQLYNAFDPTKCRRNNGYGMPFTYIVNRDGSIPWISELVYKNKKEKYIQKLILETTPPPFPKELEDDNIRIDIYVGHNKYQRVKFNYYNLDDEAMVSIEK